MSGVTIIVMSLTPMVGSYFFVADIILKAVKIPLVPYWSNHYASEGVTLMKYSVIVGCIFWGNVSALVVFAKLDVRMFLDVVPLHVKSLWYSVQEKCLL